MSQIFVQQFGNILYHDKQVLCILFITNLHLPKITVPMVQMDQDHIQQYLWMYDVVSPQIRDYLTYQIYGRMVNISKNLLYIDNLFLIC